MKYVGQFIRFILQVLFLPMALLLLGSTAILEFISRTPDWVYWYDFNRGVIDMLPFKVRGVRKEG